MRREYSIDPITINGKTIRKLIIDPHVDKHADHISDDLIKNGQAIGWGNILF